jgi:GT2 family glycosyltransferase
VDVCMVTYQGDAVGSTVEAVLRPQDSFYVWDNTGPKLGYAAGANRAAALGSGHLVAFMNPDLQPAAGFFDEIEREFDDPAVVAVAGDQGPDWRSEWEGDPEWLSGACLVVRRRAFEAVGGFDERLFMYCEDVDLSYKLRKLGRLVESRTAQARHHSSPRSLRARHQNFRNWLVVQRRHERARPGRMLRDAVYSLRQHRVGDAVTRVTGVIDYACRARRWA